MNQNKFYIVDGHSHIFAAYYAPMTRNLTSPSGLPTKAAYIFTTIILGLIQREKPDLLVVAMDSKAKTFRADLFPEYKAHRPDMPEDLPAQIKLIEQILEALNIPILRVDGYEADDIIATLVHKATADNISSVICSKDKDLLQLLDENTSILDIQKAVTQTTETLAEKMNIQPKQFIDCLALQGDTADNIPGVPDVGPKTALTWIQKYGSLESLYAHADEITGKRGDNLRKFKEQAFLSRELVILKRDVPIDINYENFKLSPPDNEKLCRIFTELGFTRLLKQLELETVADTADIEMDQPDNHKTVSSKCILVDTEQDLADLAGRLKQHKLIAVDTETNNVNPMLADLVGVSFSWEANHAHYIPVMGPLGAKTLPMAMLRKYLAPILADSEIKKIGQNIKYDIIVLNNAHLPIAGVQFDTMVASYCLDPERTSHSMDKMALDFLNYRCIPIKELIGTGKNQKTFDMVDPHIACEYAAEDSFITFQLYEHLKQGLDNNPQLRKLFDDLEMPLVPVLAQMETNGVSIDTRLLNSMSTELAEQLNVLTDQIFEQAGCSFNIGSPKQLAEILFDKLHLLSNRTGKTARSTDAEVLEQLAPQHPICELLLQYRQLTKLKNTYIDKLGSLINPKTDRLHASFNQAVTATGRLSSSNPNLQNIPIRTELGRKIRAAFIPKKPTDCILSADYSQIELRLLAHFSKDPALLDAFNRDQDIHAFVASQIYNVPLDQVTYEMRSQCKAVNFGIIYGQGPFGLSRSIGISQSEAKKFIESYYDRYNSIRQFMDSLIARAEQTGYAQTIMGRTRKLDGIRSKNANRRAQADRLAVNTVIQGSAADLIKVAMLNIQKKIDSENLPVEMILQVHDELVFELPTDQAQMHSEWIAREMNQAIKLDAPLKVDIRFGPSWLDESQ